MTPSPNVEALADAMIRIECKASIWLESPFEASTDSAELVKAIEVVREIRSEARAAMECQP